MKTNGVKRALIASAAALATLPAWAQGTAAEAPTAAPAAAAPQAQAPAQYSPQRLAALRHELSSHIAVYDAAEQAMRRPTEAERAALRSKAVASPPRIVALPGGGMAARADVADASYLVVQIQPDGKAVVSHATAQRASAKQAPSQKQGDHHDQ